MACNNPYDVFKVLTEQLSPVLHRRASYKNPMFEIVPRTEYMGYASDGNSIFTTERSEPPSEDEAWQRVTAVSDDQRNEVPDGPCVRSWANSHVGYTKWVFKPEKYEWTGVLLCRNDLGLNWNTDAFWENYYTQLEHRGAKTLVNRIVNAVMHFADKAACTAPVDFDWVPWDGGLLPLGGSATPVPDLSGLPTPLQVDYCRLDLRMLQNGARQLIEAGVTEPDRDNWITLGQNGPVFPCFIGDQALDDLITVNADLLSNIRYATASLGLEGQDNPTFRRVGATLVLKNFRFVPVLYPPRWAWNAQLGFVRVSSFIMIDTAGNDENGNPSGVNAAKRPTKGWKAVVNPIWESEDFGTGNGYNANGTLVGAPFEAAVTPNPLQIEDQILRPVNQMHNTKWNAADWMGNYQFLTGTEARSIGTGTYCPDPAGDYGIHYAQYWHAVAPIHPEYGRLWLFRRCAEEWDCVTCAT